MIDAGYVLLICFASITYVVTSVMGMAYLWDETQWFEWLKKAYIEDMNIIPITRVIGLLGYCSTIILTPILLPIVFTLVVIGILLVYTLEYISAGICWLILGRTEWKSEKKSELEKALDNSNKLATKVLQENSLDGFEAAQGEPIKRQYGNPAGTYKYFPNGTQYEPAKPREEKVIYDSERGRFRGETNEKGRIDR